MDTFLSLTKDERNKIAKIARSNKFSNSGINIIYTDSNLENIKSFYRCYRFLTNLANTDLTGEAAEDDKVCLDAKEKIKLYVDRIKDQANESLKLIELSKSEFMREKLELNERCMEFFIKNEKTILATIDFVVELGKTIKLYDPDATQGYS